MKTIISDQWQLIKVDIISILKGAAVNLAGALLIFIADYLENFDWGVAWWVPFATALAAVLVNIIRKYVNRTVYIK